MKIRKWNRETVREGLSCIIYLVITHEGKKIIDREEFLKCLEVNKRISHNSEVSTYVMFCFTRVQQRFCNILIYASL